MTFLREVFYDFLVIEVSTGKLIHGFSLQGIQSAHFPVPQRWLKSSLDEAYSALEGLHWD